MLLHIYKNAITSLRIEQLFYTYKRVCILQVTLCLLYIETDKGMKEFLKRFVLQSIGTRLFDARKL